MSTINNVSNSSNLNVQNNYSVSDTEKQTRVHHHHHKSNSQDSIQISEEAKDKSVDSAKDPLDSLVANGTITQDQENSISSAFLSARQANQTGTYGSKAANPLNTLVANGTITKEQADSITATFKSRVQPSENTNEAQGAQGNHIIHHHHEKRIQDNDSTLESILQNSESQDTLTKE